MVNLSVDEIVDIAKHTSLPTVFVEGQDDMVIFRRIEEMLGSLKANFLLCGDKNTLIGVFNRKNEFQNIPCCFLSDKDMWVFSGTPPELNDIIFTSGYSIENDLYHDSEIEKILDANERSQHTILISEVCRWFSFEVDKYNKGLEYRTDPNISRLIPIPNLLRLA